MKYKIRYHKLNYYKIYIEKDQVKVEQYLFYCVLDTFRKVEDKFVELIKEIDITKISNIDGTYDTIQDKDDKYLVIQLTDIKIYIRNNGYTIFDTVYTTAREASEFLEKYMNFMDVLKTQKVDNIYLYAFKQYNYIKELEYLPHGPKYSEAETDFYE